MSVAAGWCDHERMKLPAAAARASGLGVAALVAVSLSTAPASATITRYSAAGYQITLESDAAADHIDLACVAGQARQGGVDILPCADVQELFVRGNDGADTVDLTALTKADFPALTRIEIDGGQGADTIGGSQLADTIEADGADNVAGNGGNDIIDGGSQASGGEGDDTLTGVSGAADGGVGDDRIVNPGNGPIIGGVGFDTLELNGDIGGAPTIPFRLLLRPAADTLHLELEADGTPTPTIADISMSSIERIELSLLRTDAGRQTFDGSLFAGEVDVTGSPGADVILGNAGEDFLDGAAGNDQITGGGGFDYVTGGGGDDTINVRDGQADRVRCGPGQDTVVADATDIVSDCETVQLPSAAAAPDTSVTGPKKIAKGKKARFALSSPTAGATFECRIDKGKWRSCPNVYKVKTVKLKKGKHVLAVLAIAPDGQRDATPATKRFKVV